MPAADASPLLLPRLPPDTVGLVLEYCGMRAAKAVRLVSRDARACVSECFFAEPPLQGAQASPRRLPRWLAAFRRARAVEVGGSSFGPSAMAALASVLPGAGAQLTQLTAQRVLLNSLGCGVFAAGLAPLGRLTRLDVSNNCLGPVGAAALIEGLASLTPRLTSLVLDFTSLGEEGIAVVAAGLAFLPKLTELSVSNDYVRAGIEPLADALAHVPHLTVLRCRSNQLGPHGAAVLGAGLLHVPLLCVLDVGGNDLGPKGVAALADGGLAHVPLLQHLDLSWDNLQLEGVAALACGLAHVPSLQSLDVGNGNLGDEAMALLVARGFPLVPLLARLTVTSSRLSAEGVASLARGLKLHCPRIEALYFANPSAAVAAALAAAFALGPRDARRQRLAAAAAAAAAAGGVAPPRVR